MRAVGARTRAADRSARRRHRAFRRRAAGRRRARHRHRAHDAHPRTGSRQRAHARAARRDQPRHLQIPRAARRTTTRPTPRRKACARSAATSPRIRAARTASSTASRSTTPSARGSCSPTAASSTSARTTAKPTLWATISWACSSAAKDCSASSTEVVVRILRKPQATRTIFGTFPSTDEAGAAVSAIISGGILPAAIEMCDQLAIEAIVAATGVDWPLDAGAALLMDVDGPEVEVERDGRYGDRFDAYRRCARDSRAARRRRTDADVEGTQIGLRRDGAHLAELLRARRRDPAQRHRRGAARDRAARARRRPAHRQRLSRRRRQPASARALRRARAGRRSESRARRRRDPARLSANTAAR